MIEAKDLRIGNVLGGSVSIVPDKAVTFKGLVAGILKDKVLMGDGISTPYEYLKPIPLSEYWLLKAGFEYDGTYWRFPLYDINKPLINVSTLLLDSEDRVLIADNQYGLIIARSIQYVHQLQNLFHALTGKELLAISI